METIALVRKTAKGLSIWIPQGAISGAEKEANEENKVQNKPSPQPNTPNQVGDGRTNGKLLDFDAEVVDVIV